MTPPQDQATRLLQRIESGDSRAAAELLPLLYEELRGLARQIMGREQEGHTLQPTALIHEVFLRLVDRDDANWQNKQHFIRVAAKAMRHILVDQARARSAAKRGGRQAKVTLDEAAVVGDQGDPAAVLSVHESLEHLAAVDPQLAQIVELRFFGGLEHGEIAAALDISERTVQRGWRLARAWLSQHLQDEDSPEIP